MCKPIPLSEYSLVEVDQEQDNIESDFDKALPKEEGELGPVHHLCGIIQPHTRHTTWTTDISAWKMVYEGLQSAKQYS